MSLVGCLRRIAINGFGCGVLPQNQLVHNAADALPFFVGNGFPSRQLHTTGSFRKQEKRDTTESDTGDDERSKKKQPWLSGIFGSRAVLDSATDGETVLNRPHSSIMSDDESVYELSTHDVRGGEMDHYLKHYELYANLLSAKVSGAVLMGSWRVMFGENLDQTVHLWKYADGLSTADKLIQASLDDADVKKCAGEFAPFAQKRRAMILKSFSYWGQPKPREGPNIYDLRSYLLKPGQMIEWGNNWVKGLQFRRDHNQDVAGFFSQVGQLYMVFHFWAYKDLVTRKNVREHTWSKPGWDETVAYTVPLIKTMSSKILVPNSFSKLK